MEAETATLDKVNNWIKNSVTLKLAIITILMLLLLIPSSMIKSIIMEREGLNREAIDEVSAKWAGSQQINGPILSIPLLYETENANGKVTRTEYFHILPEELNLETSIAPEKLRRGIYEVVVYKSQIAVDGNFILQSRVETSNLKEIRYDQAFLTIGVSDLRGIKDQIEINWNGQGLKAQPGSRLTDLIYSGVTVELPDIAGMEDQSVDFSFTLNLQGSQHMSFIPLGSTTNVSLTSNWVSPSFNGNFLPDSRELNEDGFTAQWKVLQLNRNFPQYWQGNDHLQKMNEAAFGVNLLLSLDDYQKSMRSVKYVVMTIALTFLIFFLVEILTKRKIHPFQYALVGLALCLFYVLLVSISEQTNFNLAYGISTVGIVTMITLYSVKIFQRKKLTLLLLLILSCIYGFLFVTLQLADYALLMGSMGLTLILAATMYFTRNIDWYKVNIETND